MQLNPLLSGTSLVLISAISMTGIPAASAAYQFIELENSWTCEGNFNGNNGNGLCFPRSTINPGTPYKYYRGDVQSGVFTGRGVLVYSNGDRYEGQMRNGRPNGRGTFINVANSERYSGDFRNGEFYGRGNYTYKNGATYQGQFAGSQPHGLGTLTFRDEQARRTYTYRGRFYLGVVNGNGTMRSSDNIVCNGVFYSNDFSGYAECAYPLGHPSGFKTYNGYVKNSQPDGKGTVVYQDGRSAAGEFRSGQRIL